MVYRFSGRCSHQLTVRHEPKDEVTGSEALRTLGPGLDDGRQANPSSVAPKQGCRSNCESIGVATARGRLWRVWPSGIMIGILLQERR